MANWHLRLDIKDEYREAKDGTLKPHEMAHRIASKIRCLPTRGAIIGNIASLFENLDEGATFDDTDEIMELLYDWGDKCVDGLNDKQCWIATF